MGKQSSNIVDSGRGLEEDGEILLAQEMKRR